ncbi:macrophage immunometabolism regulator [Esox lucius]|uniref:Macrophage immunometabolism regulator n=1 Tax=Esox lucius TaxID=8010 RepID=A0AAY5KD01_ESOLU|nr:macrophage immunometabolism regulator [Esox lucius]XP_010885807.1 macrophage immunometabolism regulator [Esox lucius]XP_010885808.1 macrophage immunometabolism regulator [Esox lucius]
MSVKMEMDVSGVSRAPISVLPAAAEVKATLKPETVDRPRCASTPCSPIRNTVSGYQILHMDSNYLVSFTTGEELLKLAHRWSPNAEKGLVTTPAPSEGTPSSIPKPVDLGVHRASRFYKARSRYYQPYDIPAANGRRRRRMPSSSDPYLRSLSQGEGGPERAVYHGPLPHCLLKGKRVQSRSLDYLNLDKMSAREPPADTEVLQYQLQHLTLRGERVFTRNKT